MSKKDGFKNSAGFFECATCARRRRYVHWLSFTDDCYQCQEVAAIENTLDDCERATAQDHAQAKARIRRLKERAAELGGDLVRLGLTQATGEAA